MVGGGMMTTRFPLKSGGASVPSIEPDEDDEEALQVVARRVASPFSLPPSSESKVIDVYSRIRSGANRLRQPSCPLITA